MLIKPSVHRQGNWVEPAYASFYRAYIDMYRYRKTSDCNQLDGHSYSYALIDSD